MKVGDIVYSEPGNYSCIGLVRAFTPTSISLSPCFHYIEWRIMKRQDGIPLQLCTVVTGDKLTTTVAGIVSRLVDESNKVKDFKEELVNTISYLAKGISPEEMKAKKILSLTSSYKDDPKRLAEVLKMYSDYNVT